MKLKRLDLEALSELTDIELERLQYCANVGLVPQRDWLLQADDERQLDGIDELTGTLARNQDLQLLVEQPGAAVL